MGSRECDAEPVCSDGSVPMRRAGELCIAIEHYCIAIGYYVRLCDTM